MKISRGQHYLPQMYLRGFAGEAGLLYVFDRKENSYKPQPVPVTAVKNNFYTVSGPDGRKTDMVETFMAKSVEGPMKRIIERLDGRNLTSQSEDREILALFVALLLTRTPSFDKDANVLTEQLYRWWSKANNPTAEAVEKSLREYEQKTTYRLRNSSR